MIVVVALARDFHARVVGTHVERRGEKLFIADPTELGSGAELSFCPDAAERTEWRRRDGAVLRLSEAGAVWFRPKGSAAIPAGVDEPSDRQLIVREWADLLRGTLSAFGTPMINPLRAEAAATKPYQLAMALRCGLAVPDTLFTNDAHRAQAFAAEAGEVLHKTMTPLDGPLLATRPFDGSAVGSLAELELAPTIFQQRVSGTRELRITVAGERAFAAEFHTELTDGRLDRATRYAPHELPQPVTRGLLLLLERLSLPFATIDMRIDRAGDYWFLELNPAGQFLWIEIRTGLPISAAVADLLVSAARRR